MACIKGSALRYDTAEILIIAINYSVNPEIGFPVHPLGKEISRNIDKVGAISVILIGLSDSLPVLIFQPYQISGTCLSYVKPDPCVVPVSG
jgi:hypothetical protein